MRPHFIIASFGFLMLASCSSDPAVAPAGDDLLAAPPPGAGVQYRMVSKIEPGQEIERCQLVVAPPGGLFIHKDEVQFTAGSHHVVLYETPYTEIPTKDRHGVPVDGATKPHDCADGAMDKWDVDKMLAGSQSLDGDTMVGELPEGVAIKVDPGTVLLMNTHYINTAADPVTTDARINLYTISEEEMKVEAGVLMYYNPFIRIPANGTAQARMRCPIENDISIVRVQSHMHSRGVNFVADLVDGDGAVIQEMYTNTAWEQVPAKQFEPHLQIKAGQAVDYRCDYKNTEPHSVMQGLRTKDEMCMLIGPYFPRDRDLERCNDKNHQDNATFIGSGSATCAETLACVASAKPIDQDHGDDFYGCMVNSCPGAATELTAALRCQSTSGDGACAAACSGVGGDCLSCLQTACAAPISACQAVKCS